MCYHKITRLVCRDMAGCGAQLISSLALREANCSFQQNWKRTCSAATPAQAQHYVWARDIARSGVRARAFPSWVWMIIRDGANIGFWENRITEYLLFGLKWAVFVFSKRITAFVGLQNRIFALSGSKNRVNPVFQKPYSIPNDHGLSHAQLQHLVTHTRISTPLSSPIQFGLRERTQLWVTFFLLDNSWGIFLKWHDMTDNFTFATFRGSGIKYKSWYQRFIRHLQKCSFISSGRVW